MKLDNREKYEKLKRFITELKTKPNIEPFLDIEQIPKFGIYDFWYINKNPLTFPKIERKIKDAKYEYLNQFLQDLKQIFVSVSDYAFSDDPIQQNCLQFKEQIDKFGQTFVQEFQPILQIKPLKIKPVVSQSKVKTEQKEAVQTTQFYYQPPAQTISQTAVPPARPQPILQEPSYRERTSTLSQKLQMLFFLRANQNNEPYLRSIGTHYGMGTDVDDNYVLTISDKNKIWLQFIDKTQ